MQDPQSAGQTEDGAAAVRSGDAHARRVQYLEWAAQVVECAEGGLSGILPEPWASCLQGAAIFLQLCAAIAPCLPHLWAMCPATIPRVVILRGGTGEASLSHRRLTWASPRSRPDRPSSLTSQDRGAVREPTPDRTTPRTAVAHGPTRGRSRSHGCPPRPRVPL